MGNTKLERIYIQKSTKKINFILIKINISSDNILLFYLCVYIIYFLYTINTIIYPVYLYIRLLTLKQFLNTIKSQFSGFLNICVNRAGHFGQHIKTTSLHDLHNNYNVTIELTRVIQL